jgi:chromosome segregation ATPase
MVTAMPDATWKLKEPIIKLTGQEREWFSWAVEGGKEALTDEAFVADNEDASTIAGQIEDMRYRLEEQAQDVAETDATVAALRGRRRAINSLLDKLRASGYFAESFHQ